MSSYIETVIETSEVTFSDDDSAYEFCEHAFESLSPSKQAEFLSNHPTIKTKVDNLSSSYQLLTDLQKISFLESCNLYSSEYVTQLIEDVRSAMSDLGCVIDNTAFIKR